MEHPEVDSRVAKYVSRPPTRFAAALLLLVGVFWLSPMTAAASSGDRVALSLRRNVVKLNVRMESGTVHKGFGFIVGHQGKDLFLATANHVVRSGLPGDATEAIRIRFFGDPGRSHEGNLMETYYPPPQDLAVVRVRKPDGLDWETRAVVPPNLLQSGIRGTEVWFVGRAGDWYVPTLPGRVNSDRPDLNSILFVDINTVLPGTSGAPLISASGIMGMIVQDEAGGVARAVSVDAIRQAFAEWRYPWSLTVASSDQEPEIVVATAPQPKPEKPKPAAKKGAAPQPKPDPPKPKTVVAVASKPTSEPPKPESPVKVASKPAPETPKPEVQVKPAPQPKPDPPKSETVVARIPDPAPKPSPGVRLSKNSIAIFPILFQQDADRFALVFKRIIRESIEESGYYKNILECYRGTQHPGTDGDIRFDKALVDRIWVRKGWFSIPKPDTAFVQGLGRELGVQAVLLFSASVRTGGDPVKFMLVDVASGRVFEKKGMTEWLVDEIQDTVLEASSDTKVIARTLLDNYREVASP